MLSLFIFLMRMKKALSYQNVNFYAKPFHLYEENEEKAPIKSIHFYVKPFHHYDMNEKGCYKNVHYHAAFSSLQRKGSYKNVHFHAKPFYHYKENKEKAHTKMYA
jgi:hypothetical protein